jgi:hypothetical protein
MNWAFRNSELIQQGLLSSLCQVFAYPNTKVTSTENYHPRSGAIAMKIFDNVVQKLFKLVQRTLEKQVRENLECWKQKTRMLT